MFTKQHYEVLARLIAHNYNLQGFTSDLIVTLKSDDPKFDIEQFIRACGRV